MALNDLKRRIKSIKQTRKITKAVELISAAKMKQSQKKLVALTPYVSRGLNILQSLTNSLDSDLRKLSFYFVENSNLSHPKNLIVLFSSDMGLCGNYNSNIMRKVLKIQEESGNKNNDFITIGTKGQSFCKKSGYNIIATFPKLEFKCSLRDILPISKIVLNDYRAFKYKEIWLIGTDFFTITSRAVYGKRLLPIEQDLQKQIRPQYLLEPQPEIVLDCLIPRLIEVQIYQALLNAKSSEHSARMIAMHEAFTNTDNLIADLQMTYNTLRQEAITKSVIEISSGMLT